MPTDVLTRFFASLAIIKEVFERSSCIIGKVFPFLLIVGINEKDMGWVSEGSNIDDDDDDDDIDEEDDKDADSGSDD